MRNLNQSFNKSIINEHDMYAKFYYASAFCIEHDSILVQGKNDALGNVGLTSEY